jgi:16S rRNA A1518/A1519 N6-dimethyltransferase RsmA/KsgA/DIM1 with predicted DNA glycosylase/AP lyase activity
VVEVARTEKLAEVHPLQRACKKVERSSFAPTPVVSSSLLVAGPAQFSR